MEETPKRGGEAYVVIGLVVMGVGVAVLAERVAWHVDLSPRLWPAIPLGLGVLRLAVPGASPGDRARSLRTASWLLFVGVWGLLNEFGVPGFDYAGTWPLVLVFTGVCIVWSALDQPSGPGAPSRER